VDFLSPAAKVFLPQRHEDTKPDEPKILTSWLCVFVPLWLFFFYHAEGGIKIRVNPPNPRRPRCYYCRFSGI
jgi:hypothetical protein